MIPESIPVAVACLVEELHSNELVTVIITVMERVMVTVMVAVIECV